MKIYSLVLGVLFVSLSFAQESQSNYPEGINKMFDAHGTYKLWSDMQHMSFELLKNERPNEKHTINLKSRKTLIESSGFTIGFDGKDVWMNKDGKFPIERARFYHNLYFYFYAMPFVLGDPGITYTKVNDLKFDGESYTGFMISYGENVGDSPDDNYFVYLDKKTHQMVWLGYTVTYGDDKPSTEIHYIKYVDWTSINGLLLPKTLQWYDSKMNLPNSPTNKAGFENVMVSKQEIEASKFMKPSDGIIGVK